MATTRITSTLAVSPRRRAPRRRLGAAGKQIAPQHASTRTHEHEENEEYEEEGYAAAKARQQEPDAIEAAFPLESYRPGATAVLRIWTATRDATVRVFHVGPEPPADGRRTSRWKACP